MKLLVGDVFRRAGASVPQHAAASMGDAVMTYGELDRAGNRLAHTLRARGVKHGDRVVWWGDTCLDAMPMFVALARLGAVFAPVNARYGLEEATPVVAKAPSTRAAISLSPDGSSDKTRATQRLPSMAPISCHRIAEAPETRISRRRRRITVQPR